jgi:phosphate transport system substrate-binding protein
MLFLCTHWISCSSSEKVEDGVMIRIDGSSTVYPLTEAIVEEYRKINPSTRVTIGISGTGGGFEKFIRGETDISDASRAMGLAETNSLEEKGYQYLELPVAFDGIVVVVHPTNHWCQDLTTHELKKLWEPASQGRIVSWKHLRDDWPDEKISLFGPGVDSGTYDYFTRVIAGEKGWSRGDYTSSEDDNILVSGVASEPGALGFFSFVYYLENRDRLKVVPIDDLKSNNGEGPILPDSQTIGSVYQPLSRPVFIYVRMGALGEKGLSEFVEFYIRNAGRMAKEVGYTPLSESVYELVLERFHSRLTGSIFHKTDSLSEMDLKEFLLKNSG